MQVLGIIIMFMCLIWAIIHLVEMFGLFETKPGDKLDRCPHCGDWTRYGDDIYVDEDEFYHGKCWDKTHGKAKEVKNASK